MDKKQTRSGRRTARPGNGRPAAPRRRPGTIRVLLADDHEILRQALVRFLSRQPDLQIVGQAGDGATAVKLARSRRPDVIVMDLSLPGMHGVQATRLIRAQCPLARVIGFSAFAAPEHSRAMRQAGATHFLTKRDKPSALVAAIRASVRRARKRSRAPFAVTR